jgi:signal transduction histidine kinase
MLACLVISAIVWGSAIEGQWAEHRELFWVDVVLGLLAYVMVFWRRRFPLTVALAAAVLGMFSGLAAGPATLAAVSLATRRNLPQILLVGVVNVVTAQGFVTVQPVVVNDDPEWLNLAINFAVISALLAIGMYVGSRRELLWTLRERALRAETEQALRVGQARATERERIAREMHDVLGHRISLVTMHAGALSFREDLSRAEVAASARIIQDNAHQAMVELRGILGVLRGADDTPDRPQPTLSDVPALVDEARSSGTPVDLTVDLPDRVPEQVGRTVYRVVQEGLTNARKHAGAARVTVRVSGSPESGVTARIANPLPPGSRPAAAPGYGLIGLTERAKLASGTLRWDVRDRRFVLEVWLPWQA